MLDPLNDLILYFILIVIPVIFFLSRKRISCYLTEKSIKILIEDEKLSEVQEEESQIFEQSNKSDTQVFYGCDQNGSELTVKVTIKSNLSAHSVICLRVKNKTYTNLEKNDTYLVKNTTLPKSEWNINGLKIQILEPFVRIKLSFNGLLRNIETEIEEHITFSLIFNCCSRPSIFLLDDDLNLLARSIAHTQWKSKLGEEKGYVQFGALKGTVLDEEKNFSCARQRYWGRIDRSQVVSIFSATEDGYLIYLCDKTTHSGIKNVFGHVYLPSGCLLPIRNSQVTFHSDSAMSVQVSIDKKVLNCVFRIHKNAIKLINEAIEGYKCSMLSAQCLVNGSEGSALIELWSSHRGTEIERQTEFLKPIDTKEAPKIFVTSFDSEEAKITQLVGGKATSLALMRSMRSDKFIVPNGFIVTSYAFECFIKQNEQTFDHLRKVANGIIEGDLKETCKKTSDAIKNLPYQPEISSEISSYIDKLDVSKSWAVRSSAIWEDSEDLSAAGQNETYLGCRTTEILERIKDCWISMFAYQSVEYRRQHSVPIVASMAVVVQEMVPSETAGVMFTCHPSSGNPSEILITANYGLGETVVSGESEPDTFVLAKSLRLKSSEAGSKSNVMKMINDRVIKCENDVGTMCLSNEQVVRLGNVGLLLESSFGNHRDIEWAFYGNELYLLQCRPVTMNQWSDYDLLHELDSPHLSIYTYYTRGNIGEVLPNPLTVLTQTTIQKYLERNLQKRILKSSDKYAQKCILSNHHVGFLDLFKCIYFRPRKKVEVASKITDITIFGHEVLDEKLNEIAVKVNGDTKGIVLLSEVLRSLRSMIGGPYYLKKLQKLAQNFHVDIEEDDDCLTVYERIDESLPVYEEISRYHCEISNASVFFEIISMITMMEGAEEISMEHKNDLSLILSSCDDVVSASIPKMQQDIALLIKRSGKAEQFSKLDRDRLDWLKENVEDAYNSSMEFFKVHGHRTLSELELAEEGWGANPEKIMGVLQRIVGNVEEPAVKEKIDIIDNLKSPKKNITRKLLRFLVGQTRRALRNREYSKSELSRGANIFRSAYKKLARKMVNEGLLPDESLIYHLTHYEISRVLQRENLSLVTKALRRQKLLSQWKDLQFPEISFGAPKPENEMNFEGSEACCIGTPVSMGEVTGRACVILSLDEIGILQKGDILLTKSTDIGWSPYFPMLSGVVTELGGLISHGAVVAREYGLPCLIGTKNATRVFKTGDKVFLSGKRGKVYLCDE